MSYYDEQTPEALWGIAMQRMAEIPLPVNREDATGYLEHRRAVGTIKPPTLGRDADELKRLGCWAGERAFRDVGRRGIVAFFGTLASLEPGTRYKAYVVVRAFFRWLHDLDDDDKPPEFKGFKMKRPKRRKLRKEDLLTQEEFSKMLRFCRDSQERCLFAWAYEAGPRATEALAGDIRDVHKDDYGYVIHLRDVPGLKTGPRPLRAIQSAPYFD